MARVKKEELRNVDENNFLARVKKYSFLKSQLDYLEKEQKEERSKLFEVLDTEGEEDDKGNIFIDLPEEVDGIVAIVKERRVSRKINEAKAEEIIEAKGLQDKLFKTIRVIDEDALMAALYSDELTEEEVEEMYPQSIIWALKLKK
mgnify:FL=1